MMEQRLQSGLAALNLPVEGIPALVRYGDLLIETNKVMNLTAITDPEDVATLHFLDSAALLTLESFSGKSVVDVGTGAGFPGLPLRVLEPSIRLTLLDSLNKRIQFLETVCRELDLPDVACVHARAEEFAAEPAAGKARREVPGHEIRGVRRGAGRLTARHCDPGRRRGGGPGLCHPRYRCAPPADRGGKSEKNSGKISENVCKNQEESLIIHL